MGMIFGEGRLANALCCQRHELTSQRKRSVIHPCIQQPPEIKNPAESDPGDRLGGKPVLAGRHPWSRDLAAPRIGKGGQIYAPIRSSLGRNRPCLQYSN
jgi:hypothetical protein